MRNGLLILALVFVSSLSADVSKEYYNNGALKKITPYTNGKVNGYFQTYFSNGQLNENTHYTNGVKNGITQLYFRNGQLKTEFMYKNGKIAGA